jgi:hypothetical protein
VYQPGGAGDVGSKRKRIVKAIEISVGTSAANKARFVLVECNSLKPIV